MGAREFEIDRHMALKIPARKGDSLRVRVGEVWVTQHQDRKDYVLKAGDSMALNGNGATLAFAFKPTLLDLYREDPVGLRRRIESEAKRLRAQAVWALLRKVFA